MIGKNFLEKHKKYLSQYDKNELYWGVGIENETYLEFSNKLTVSKDFFLNNHKPERYSVNYYNVYKKECLSDIFNQYYTKFENSEKMQTIEIPFLINSHSFTKTDCKNQHKTLYLSGSPPNPKFNGKTIDEDCKEKNFYFSEQFDKNFTYDGDTVEFITQQFYKTTIDRCIEELLTIKEEFIENIQEIFPFQKEYGKIRFMERNYPFAIHFTNKNNISMFNNGTYHFNFTLPTHLNDKGAIDDEEKFLKDHCHAIRVLQLFSPLFLCMYGSSDPFSKVNDTFSACSQRCSVSRYIGIGTYDTDHMKKGKILTLPIEELSVSKLPFWWFRQFHSHSSYVTLNEIGMDINFNKHHFHGIEFRIFDHFPEEHLDDLLTFIVHLFDIALEKKEVPNYIKTEEWNNMTAKCMRYGKNTSLTSSELYLFEQFLGKSIHSSSITTVYNEITSILHSTKNSKMASRYMKNKNQDFYNKKMMCCKII